MPAPKRPNTAEATATRIRSGQETMAAKLRAADWHVFKPGELYLRHVDHEGVRMKVIPAALHDVLCTWRVATPQGTEPEVLGCAGCGFCYPPIRDTPE